MPVCAGCNVEFIGKSYTLHLKLTTNPPCVAIFKRADGQGTQAQDHEYFGSPAYHGLPSGKFASDFFGADYAPEDFGYILEDEDDSPAGRPRLPTKSRCQVGRGCQRGVPVCDAGCSSEQQGQGGT
jgi:hypothetical protein